MCPRAGRAGVAAARSAVVATLTIVWVALPGEVAETDSSAGTASGTGSRTRHDEPATPRQCLDGLWATSGRVIEVDQGRVTVPR